MQRSRNHTPFLIIRQAYLRGFFWNLTYEKLNGYCFGGYNQMKINIDSYLQTLSSILDKHLPKYDNIIPLADFNAEIVDSSMQQFCETYHLNNLIKDPTCFKNPPNPSSIDLILTNRPKKFYRQYSYRNWSIGSSQNDYNGIKNFPSQTNS